MASLKLAVGDGSYDFHLRSLSTASRDYPTAVYPMSDDPNILRFVSASPSKSTPPPLFSSPGWWPDVGNLGLLHVVP